MTQPKGGIDSWWTPIDKLSFWSGGSWIKYNDKSPNLTMLRLHYDQIFIIADNKLLESFNMNSRLRGIYKEDVLIMIMYANKQEIRKLKFQIKSNSKYYYKKLSQHFPVTCHKSSLKKDNMIYRNIEEIFLKALQADATIVPNISLPSMYAEFVKICLLDPIFPFVVEETRKIIQMISKPDDKC